MGNRNTLVGNLWPARSQTMLRVRLARVATKVSRRSFHTRVLRGENPETARYRAETPREIRWWNLGTCNLQRAIFRTRF